MECNSVVVCGLIKREELEREEKRKREMGVGFLGSSELREEREDES